MPPIVMGTPSVHTLSPSLQVRGTGTSVCSLVLGLMTHDVSETLDAESAMRMRDTVAHLSSAVIAGTCCTAGDGKVGSMEPVPVPPWTKHIAPGLNPDFSAETLRFSAESPAHPEHSYDYRYSCCVACHPTPSHSESACTSIHVGGSSKAFCAFLRH